MAVTAMKEKYKAAFIIPIGTHKVLGEDGWEFETLNRLSSEIKEFLVDALNLHYLESYLGIDAYVSESVKMSVIYDDQSQIESISFQLYGDAVSGLSRVFRSGQIANKSELFIPAQSNDDDS